MVKVLPEDGGGEKKPARTPPKLTDEQLRIAREQGFGSPGMLGAGQYAVAPNLTEEQQKIARDVGFGSPGMLAHPLRVEPPQTTTNATTNEPGGVAGAVPSGTGAELQPPTTTTVTGNPPATGMPLTPKSDDLIVFDQLNRGGSFSLSSDDLKQDTPAARYILKWAASQDIVPQAGWKWTITLVRGEPLISFMATDGWTIQSDGTCISPSHVRYGISEIRHLVHGIFTQTEEIPSLDGLSDQEVEDILKEADPKVTLAPKGMNAGLAESLGMLPHAQLRQYVMDELVERQKRYDKLRDYSCRLFGHSDIDALLARINQDPAAFLADIIKIGRNDDTEGLLYALNPDYTDNDIREIFGQEPILSLEEWKALGSTRQIDIIVRGVRGGNTNAVFGGVPGQGINIWNLTEAEIQNLIQSDEEFARWGYTQYVNYMLNDSVAATFNRAFGEGIGEITAALALGAKWLGADGVGKALTERAEDDLALRPDNPGPLTWENVFNWRFWVTNIGEALPMQLAMLPVDLLGGWAVGAITDHIVTSGLGKLVLDRLCSAALEGVLSSAVQAAIVYDKALETMSPLEAKKAAEEAFGLNLMLIGVSAAAIGLDTAFMPSKLIAAAERGYLEIPEVLADIPHQLSYNMVTAAGQEVLQEAIRAQVLGQKLDWDEEKRTAVAVAAFVSGSLQTGIDTFSKLAEALVHAMPDDMRANYDNEKARLLSGSLNDELATYEALDAITQTAEGQTVLDAVMETDRLVSLWKTMTFKDEAEKLAWSATMSQLLMQANPDGYHIEIDIELEGSFAVFAGTRLK